MLGIVNRKTLPLNNVGVFSGSGCFKNDAMITWGWTRLYNSTISGQTMQFDNITYVILQKVNNADVFGFKTINNVSTNGALGVVHLEASPYTYNRAVPMIVNFIYDGTNSYVAIAQSSFPLIPEGYVLEMGSQFALVNTQN